MVIKETAMSVINYNISSTSTSHYTEALDQFESEQEDFPGFAGDGCGFVAHVAVRSLENLAWGVEILDNDDNILQSVTFTEEEAKVNVVSSVTYYYYNREVRWSIPLTRRAVQVALRNNSSTAKTAGTSGAVTVYFVLEK